VLGKNWTELLLDWRHLEENKELSIGVAAKQCITTVLVTSIEDSYGLQILGLGL
jgi:hypothetical protein